MNIYTFYEPINNSTFSDNKKILEVWKKSWSYYGWNPIVLTLEDCKKHSFYEKYREKCESFPTVNDKNYEILCYLRWLAMANLGGWHCDFDVINYGFEPIDYKEKIVSCTHWSLGASTVHLPKNGYENLINLIYNYEVSEKDINTEFKRHHVSDMTILNNLRNYCNIDLCLDCEAVYSLTNHGQELWTKMKLIHFASAFVNGEKLNKILNFEKTSKLLS
jgi:hypothetical protein